MTDTLLFPQRLTLEVTNRCNLACHFCPRHQAQMPQGDMEAALFQRLVDEAAEHLPVSLVVFFRGEPLLHPQLPELIRYAKNKGLGPIQMASNGLLLNKERAGQIIDSGLDFISFSLDTNDEALYQRARVNGHLATARANILYFIDEVRRMKAPLEIQISSVDHPDYQPGQRDFIDFWQPKADKVRIYAEHGADGKFGSLSQPLKSMDRRPCRKVFTDMVVYWNGQAALCNHDWQHEGNLGNLTSRAVAEVWNSPAYEKVRMAHQRANFKAGDVCGACDHWRIYYNEDGLIGELYARS